MVNNPEYVPSGMHCGCSQPAVHDTFRFKLRADVIDSVNTPNATAWTCSLVDLATSEETVVGQLVVVSNASECAPVIIANAALLRMATAAGG